MPGSGRQLTMLPTAMLVVADRAPVTALAAVLGAAIVAPGVLAAAAPAIVVVGLLVGLPHGAVDHLVPAWVRARRTAPTALVALLVAYVGAAASMFGLLHTAPRVGLALFLLLSLWHFGSGEASWAAQRHSEGWVTGPGTAASALQLTQVVAWGGVVVVLPVIRWPAEVAPLLDGLASGTSALLGPVVRTGLGVAVLGAVLVTMLAAALRGRRQRTSPAPAAELALVTAAMLTAPPLVAFAVWFGLWHSLRHIVRLLAADPANRADLARRRSAPALRRFARQAALPTLAALAALLVLVATADGVAGFLTLDVQLLAALTVPHMAVVTWSDRHDTAATDRGPDVAEPGPPVEAPGLRVRS